MKKILTLLLLAITPVLFASIKATEIPTEIPATEVVEEEKSFTFYDNSYFDLLTGTYLTFDNHTISDMGYEHDYAKNWLSSGRMIIDTSKDNFNISLKYNAHYVLFWNGTNDYLGYYQLFEGTNNQTYDASNNLSLDPYKLASSKFLGQTTYENIPLPIGAYRFAIMTNVDKENSNISNNYTYDYLYNNKVYNIPLPVITPNYSTYDDLFTRQNTYNNDNNDNLVVINNEFGTQITINGLTITFNNTSKNIEIDGVASSDTTIRITNTINNSGKYFISKTWGIFDGIEGGGIHVVTSGSSIIEEFFDIENYGSGVVNFESLLINEPSYLEITASTGDDFSEYNLSIEFNEYLGPFYQEVSNQTELNALDTTFNQNNAYYSNYVDTPNTAVTTFISDSAFGGDMRIYDAQSVVDNYLNDSGYEIDMNNFTMGYSTYKTFQKVANYVYSTDCILNFSQNDFRFMMNQYQEMLFHENINNDIISFDYLDYYFNDYDNYIVHTYTYFNLLVLPSITSFTASANTYTISYNQESITTGTTGTGDTGSTGDNVTNEADIGNTLNVFFDSFADGNLFKTIFILVVIVATSIALFIFNVKWLIVMLVDMIILVAFVAIGWVPTWLVILGSIIIFIISFTLFKKY